MTVLVHEPISELPIGELPVADYGLYREHCDNADSYRTTGILDPAGYEAATEDPATVFCGIGGVAVPAIVRVEYEGGYDAGRCKQLTGRDTTMLLAVPTSSVLGGALDARNIRGGEALPDRYAVLVEEPRTNATVGSPEERALVARHLSSLGRLRSTGEFLDMPAKPGFETAWMAMYSYPFTASEAVKQAGPAASGFDQAWEWHKAEQQLPEVPSGKSTYMFTGEQLRDDPDLIDKLWSISEIGFGKVLGQNHPVSMEETRAFFDAHLFAPGTYTAIHYDEGEPVCFGSMATGLDNCEWLNLKGSRALQRELHECEVFGETPFFFSEVISNGKVGAAYSMNIFGLFTALAARTQQRYRLFFESTNRSSRYIPRGVQRAIDESGLIRPLSISGKIEKVDQMDYWFVEHER